MDIWSLLGIDATSDTRAIKRAYASKLKVTRPDEHPEAFQELHYAYKAALNYACELEYGQNAPQHSAPIPDTTLEPVETQPHYHVPESIVLEPNPPSALDIHPIPTTDALESQDATPTINAETLAQEPEVEINPYQHEGERLVALTQILLNTQDELHVPASWEFLLHSPYILDDQFNWRLGLEILRLIQAHNQHYANKPLMHIGTGVMTYLDELFNWKLNRYHIYRFLNEDEFSSLLEKIAEQEPLQQTQHALDGLRGAKSIKVVEAQTYPNTLYYASPIKRFIALMIDAAVIVLMLAIAFYLIRIKSHNQPIAPEGAMIGALACSFIYFWAAECSEYQATFGKWIMGLIVTNKDLEPLTPMRSFWRSLVFHLSSSLTYIVLIINAMMGDKLLHDRITKTYVIDIRRSRKQ